MLDLQRMHHLELTGNPVGQKIVASCLLAPNYWWAPGVDIRVEGWEAVPDEPVIYAMNHTDRYNYWPFQFQLWWEQDRYTATWVKGKYYQNEWLARFMEWTNNIPTVSRGYLISRDFLNVVGRKPESEEYERLRELVDAVGAGRDDAGPSEAKLEEIPRALFDESRDMLGLHYDPEDQSYAERINELFRAMMERFVELNGEAFDRGLDLLIFPQGTRSIRLTRGRIGLSQIALYYRRPVVPVGCSGSDRVYPGDSPVAQSGEIVYRIGEPVTRAEMEPYLVDEGFRPFSAEAERRYRQRFQEFVDGVMERIDGLVDERYRFREAVDGGDRGTDRFV